MNLAYGTRSQHPFGHRPATVSSRRMLPGRQTAAARPPSGCCLAAGRLLGRLLPSSGRQPPDRWAAAAAAAGQHPLDRTTPKHNLKTPAYAAILIFCDDLYSPEKRLTVPICTCRGRAPETSPDHRTRQIAPLLCGRFLCVSAAGALNVCVLISQVDEDEPYRVLICLARGPTAHRAGQY